MNIDDIFAIDKRREEGAWVKTPSGDLAGLPLKVRSANSEVATRLSAKIWAETAPGDRAKPDFMVSLEKRVILGAILVDWRLDRPFEPETAKAMVETAAFREAVNLCASRVGADGAETMEQDAKN